MHRVNGKFLVPHKHKQISEGFALGKLKPRSQEKLCRFLSDVILLKQFMFTVKYQVILMKMMIIQTPSGYIEMYQCTIRIFGQIICKRTHIFDF